jgi:hypothetical protein
MEKDNIYYDKIDDQVFLGMVKRRRIEAEGHWDKDQNLKSVRERNNKEYLGKYVEEQLVDERYQEIYNDNRQFTSVRTIVPFLTARITAPEVVPANGTDLSLQFAKDFEEALQKHAEKQKARAKVRLAVQDLLRGERVGILMWRFDPLLDTVSIEHLDPNTVVIGKRSKLFEEPDYIGRKIERSVGDLLKIFPDKADKIKQLFGITKGVPSQLEKIYELNEDWIWVDNEDEKDLIVGWSYQNVLFGKIKDPNFKETGKNLIERSMMPFVFFNFLNNGKGYIDETSFIEQARHLQRNYNKRGQTIAENAKYGGTGVPIFAKGTISQKDVARIRFSPIQRVLLDTPDINKAFTVWQSSPLPQYIVEDKYDDRNSIDNIWGTPNVFRGEQSKNNTLGQDVLIRNQAEGRLADPVDCIDDSMTRFYQLEAQMMYRWFDEKKFYNYLGNDGKFVSVVISKEEIARNLGIEIGVKAGTSLPIDRAQQRSTVIELLRMNKVGTLTAYKELGLFDNPEEAYKEFVMEQLDPKTALSEVDKTVFSREANQDLYIVIGGGEPDEREDIDDQYVAHLNEWLLTDKYKILQEKNPEVAAKVSDFIDSVIAKASRKANKLAMQPAPDGQEPVPPEVQAMVDAQGGQPQAPQMAGAMPSAVVQ